MIQYYVSKKNFGTEDINTMIWAMRVWLCLIFDTVLKLYEISRNARQHLIAPAYIFLHDIKNVQIMLTIIYMEDKTALLV